MTRRSFLTGVAGVCAEAALPIPRQVSSEREDETVWALLADTHVHESRKKTIRGSNMAGNLRAIVPEVVGARPAHVLFDGDMAEKAGNVGDYETFRALIKPLVRANIPLHFTLGNHDQRANFVAALAKQGDSLLEGKWVSSVTAGGVHWLMLDSLEKVNAMAGALGDEQRDWLAKRLDTCAATPTIVVLHHDPKESPLGLTDARELLDVVLPRRQVKAVIFGHRHVYRHWSQEGLHFVNLPAVGYWFNPTEPLGWVIARVRAERMELEFRGVNRDAARHGEVKTFEFRSNERSGE